MDPFEQSHTIAVDFEVYGLGYLDRHKAACFEMIMGSRHDSQWQTVAKLVRPGDRLTLVWRPDWLSNAYSQKASYDGSVGDCPSYHGLHVDTLYLQVIRKHTTAYMFLIDVSVCPDNSARMIRNVS
jgi:hypothetical protein